MSLGSTLALSIDAPTDVDTNEQSFVLRAADRDRGEYSVAGLTLPEARILTISHQTGGGGEKRHLVRIDHTLIDAFGVPATLSVYTVIVRPQNTAITDAKIIENVNCLVDFWIGPTPNVNVPKILNSEV